MTRFIDQLAPAWVQSAGALRLGSALLHFLWQGALLAAVAMVLLAMLKRAKPQVRYAALLAIFALSAACPAITYCVLSADSAAEANRIEPRSQAAVAPTVASPGTPIAVEAEIRLPANAVAPLAQPTTTGPSVSRWILPRVWLNQHRHWIVIIWLAGVCVLSLRLLVGLIGAELARRRAIESVGNDLQQLVARLSRQMNVRPFVQVLQSGLAEVPSLIGWLRPVILLPASAISGLAPAELEAILAHELAHVRRHDYLVNLLQTVVETFLFYHPAVWWLSRRIRQEREHCCDDVALAICRDRLTYARALSTLAELRPTPRWAIAARGGSLIERIRRIVGQPQPDSGGSLAVIALVFSLSLITLFAALSNQALLAQAPAVKKDANPAPAAKAAEKPPYATYEFKVVTAKGEPMANTTVTPWQISWRSTKENDGMSGSFFKEDDPLAAPLKTDAAGKFTFIIPADSYAAEFLVKEKKVLGLGFRIDHPDHPPWMKYARLDQNHEIVLADSATVVVRVRREGQEAIPRNLYPSPETPDWSEKDGVVTIRRLDLSGKSLASKAGNRWLRIVQANPGEPAWFSDLIDLENQADLSKVEAVLRPGVRLAGSLSDNVPRPVKEGRLVTIIGSPERGWRWSAMAEIAADGTFAIESLPANETVQLIARCEGWVSSSPSLEELKAAAAATGFSLTAGDEGTVEGGYFVVPRLFHLSGRSINPVIPMEATMTCEVKVVDSAGRPIPKALVSFCPNQYWYHFGSQLVGQGDDSLKRLLTRRAQGDKSPFPKWEHATYFDKVTDERGIAIVGNLPNRSSDDATVPREFEFSVSHDDYGIAEGEDDDGQIMAKVTPGETAKITVRMQPK